MTVITLENLMCKNVIIVSFSGLEKYLSPTHHLMLSRYIFFPLQYLGSNFVDSKINPEY